MTYKEFLTKWQIKQPLLAEKTGMSTGAFHNKFSDSHFAKFTVNDLSCIKAVLREMKSDLKKVEL